MCRASAGRARAPPSRSRRRGTRGRSLPRCASRRGRRARRLRRLQLVVIGLGRRARRDRELRQGVRRGRREDGLHADDAGRPGGVREEGGGPAQGQGLPRRGGGRARRGRGRAQPRLLRSLGPDRLDQGRLGHGRPERPLEPKRLDVNRLVGGMSDLLVRTLGETIIIETVLGAGLWKVWADPTQLESALLNLSVNARDAMPEGGKLTIETSNAYVDERYAKQSAIPAGQFVLLAVTDTGRGMAPEIIEKAFDPFFTTKDV